MSAGVSRRRLVQGGAWLIAARAFERLIGLVSMSILARLLTPADFGLVAIAGTVVSAIQIFSQFGFDWALVRYRNPSTNDLNTAWTLRVLMGATIFAALVLAGPAAANFYHLEPLKEVLAVLGLSSFVASLENIGTVYFRREFTFHKEFVVRAIAKATGFSATVTLAILYRSYWALVLGIVATNCATTVTSYFVHPYRPWLSLRGARRLFGFSIWLLIANLAEYFRERFSELYLGRVYGAGATGLFAVTGEMSIVPITEIAAPINRVAYAKYSEDVRANRSVTTSYLTTASLIWALALPMALGTVAVAPQAVEVLLGSKWGEAVPVLRLLALGMAFTVATSNTHYVYWALGHSRVTAALTVIGAGVAVFLSIIGSHFLGYVGVAMAFAVQSALLVPVNFWFLRRIAAVNFVDLYRRIWRIVLGAALMFVVLYAIFPERPELSVSAAAWTLLCEIACGAALYATVVLLSWWMAGRPEGPERVVFRMILSRMEMRGA